MGKMLNHIDADQLLEVYGGSLKMPPRIWPPVDTYSREARLQAQPFQPQPTESNPIYYFPGINGAKKPFHSIIPNPAFSANDFETRDPNADDYIPSEPLPIKASLYRADIKMLSNMKGSQLDRGGLSLLQSTKSETAFGTDSKFLFDELKNPESQTKNPDVVIQETNIKIKFENPAESNPKSSAPQIARKTPKKGTCILF